MLCMERGYPLMCCTSTPKQELQMSKHRLHFIDVIIDWRRSSMPSFMCSGIIEIPSPAQLKSCGWLLTRKKPTLRHLGTTPGNFRLFSFFQLCVTASTFDCRTSMKRISSCMNKHRITKSLADCFHSIKRNAPQTLPRQPRILDTFRACRPICPLCAS